MMKSYASAVCAGSAWVAMILVTCILLGCGGAKDSSPVAPAVDQTELTAADAASERLCGPGQLGEGRPGVATQLTVLFGERVQRHREPVGEAVDNAQQRSPRHHRQP